MAYFAYATALSWLRPITHQLRIRFLLVNAAIVALLAGLAMWERRGGRAAGFIRDWLPLYLALVCFREAGWLAVPAPARELEHAWIIWDRKLLHDWGGRAAIESLAPLLPLILELAYLLTYVVGVGCTALLWGLRERAKVDRVQFLYLLGLLVSYALLPYFPSEPPWTVFPGADQPSIDVATRRLNLYLVGSWGIHTGVFPSAHVSGAYAAAIGLFYALPRRRYIAGVMLVIATLIAVATVYGRYHYAVDAVAGIGIAALGFPVARRLFVVRA